VQVNLFTEVRSPRSVDRRGPRPDRCRGPGGRVIVSHLTPTREPLMLVAGVDSSTQSTKVLLCQADDGTIVGEAAAPHPDGTECDPELWWQALVKAGDGLLDRADAIGVAAQQHGMVVVDEADRVIRPALLWNDVRSAPQAAALIAEMGGPGYWARLTGSVPTASFT